jgi:chemotaxis protein MotB
MARKRRQHHELENQDRWLLTYADMITLLLGLFAILYAFSKIDNAKYAAMVTALGDVFGSGKEGVIVGKAGVMPGSIAAIQSERNQIAQEVRRVLEGSGSGVTISNNERGVTVHMAEQLLFASGSADLKESSLQTLDALAQVIKRLPNDIRVEGHTDNVPINTPRFPSNWHLSVNRAVNTAFYMMERHSLDRAKISVVGFAEFHPLEINANPEARAKNRRVDIIIITNVAAGSGTGPNGTQEQRAAR